MWQDEAQLNVQNMWVIKQKTLLEVGFKYLCFTNDVGYDIKTIVRKGQKFVAEQKCFFRKERSETTFDCL